MIGVVLSVQVLGKFSINLSCNSLVSIMNLHSYTLFCLNNDRILAPTTYIFFASALPVIAFGEQLSRDTGSSFASAASFLILWLKFIIILLRMNLSIVYFVGRWKIEHSRNTSFNGHMWNHTFNYWRAATTYCRSCRTNHHHVYLFV